MVDMSRFSEEVGVMLSSKTLATSLEVTVIVGGAAAILEDDHDGLPQSKVAKRTVGVATMDTDLTFGIDLRDLQLPEQEQPHVVPVQVQLRYMRLDGEEVLQVVTVLASVTEVRSVAESSINGTGIALQGIHKVQSTGKWPHSPPGNVHHGSRKFRYARTQQRIQTRQPYPSKNLDQDQHSKANGGDF
eukprot:1373387-Amphidinium_carterae.1